MESEEIRCAIFEDEFLNQQILIQKINEYFPTIKIVAICDNVKDATLFLRSNPVDLVFLDIQINGGTIFEVLENIPLINFQCIYLTAHESFAIKALNKGAIHYLLKPFRDEDFKEAVSKFIRNLEKTSDLGQMNVVENKVVHIVQLRDIIYFKSSGAYTEIITTKRRFITSKNIGVYQKVLPPPFFSRCHNSTIVNIRQIQSLSKKRDLSVVMKNDHVIPVSRRRALFFKKCIKEASRFNQYQ